MAILHLEGEPRSASPLNVYDAFEARLTAKNMGNTPLEDVVFRCMAQTADGKCLAQLPPGLSGVGAVTMPGAVLEYSPALPITQDMAMVALSAQCVNEFAQPGTITFTFQAQYTYRSDEGQVLPGVSNMVSFTVPIREEEKEGIALTGVTDLPPQPTSGDPANAKLTIQNIGQEDLTGLRLGVQQKTQLGFTSLQPLIDEGMQIFRAGETRTFDFNYTVSLEDAAAGLVGFKFIASAQRSTEQSMCYVSAWEFGGLLGVPETGDNGGRIQIGKHQDNAPHSGQNAFRLNDAIHYTIELNNTYGFPVTNIAVYDDMAGYSPVLLGTVDLESGQTKFISFTHPVMPQDVALQQVKNTAYAQVVVNDPTSGELLEDYTVWSNPVTTPVEDSGDAEGNAVRITKTATSTPKDPMGYREGETIEYDIVVYNGHQTKAEVNVWDWISSADAPDLVAQVTLAPGETQNYAHSHTVQPNDVAVGQVTNTAYTAVLLNADNEERISGYTVWAAPVTVPVLPSPGGEDNNTTIVNPPVTDAPVTEDPVIEPPVTDAPVTEDPVIEPPVTDVPVTEAPLIPPETVTPDVSPDHQPGSFCRRVLTGLGSSEARYELIFCDRHLSVALSARGMTGEQAKNLWTEAVNDCYQALAARYPGDTAVLIDTERTLFFDQLAAFQTVAAAREGEEKALTRAVEQLRSRCLELCYALHTAPDQRLDSALREGIPSISEKGDVPGKCLMEQEEAPFGSRIMYRVCREHLFIQNAMSRLRSAAASGRDAADAFRKSKSLWKNALMEAGNALYRDAAPEGKAAIADSLNLFHQWLNARQNVLLALYPQDEAAALEAVSFAVQNRVFVLEGMQR